MEYRWLKLPGPYSAFSLSAQRVVREGRAMQNLPFEVLLRIFLLSCTTRTINLNRNPYLWRWVRPIYGRKNGSKWLRGTDNVITLLLCDGETSLYEELYHLLHFSFRYDFKARITYQLKYSTVTMDYGEEDYDTEILHDPTPPFPLPETMQIDTPTQCLHDMLDGVVLDSKIDSAKFFIEQHYLRVVSEHPLGMHRSELQHKDIPERILKSPHIETSISVDVYNMPPLLRSFFYDDDLTHCTDLSEYVTTDDSSDDLTDYWEHTSLTLTADDLDASSDAT